MLGFHCVIGCTQIICQILSLLHISILLILLLLSLNQKFSHVISELLEAQAPIAVLVDVSEQILPELFAHVQVIHAFEVALCKSISYLISRDLAITVEVEDIKGDTETLLVDQLRHICGSDQELVVADLAIAILV